MGFNVNRELKRFLKEDIGKGDITSKLVRQQQITAKIISREETIVAGNCCHQTNVCGVGG